MNQQEPYENTLTIEHLRSEVRRYWDAEHDLKIALTTLPDVPPITVLWLLSSIAINVSSSHPRLSLGDRGKKLQRDYPPPPFNKDDAPYVPYKCEFENAAGLWDVIRKGIQSACEDTEVLND